MLYWKLPSLVSVSSSHESMLTEEDGDEPTLSGFRSFAKFDRDLALDADEEVMLVTTFSADFDTILLSLDNENLLLFVAAGS